MLTTDGGRSAGQATEAQVKATLKDPDVLICEWEYQNLTFLCSYKTGCILQTSAMGGGLGAYQVNWGLYYMVPKFQTADWADITRVGTNVKVDPDHRSNFRIG